MVPNLVQVEGATATRQQCAAGKHGIVAVRTLDDQDHRTVGKGVGVLGLDGEIANLDDVVVRQVLVYARCFRRSAAVNVGVGVL